jgi:hypothetical protein
VKAWPTISRSLRVIGKMLLGLAAIYGGILLWGASGISIPIPPWHGPVLDAIQDSEHFDIGAVFPVGMALSDAKTLLVKDGFKCGDGLSHDKVGNSYLWCERSTHFNPLCTMGWRVEIDVDDSRRVVSHLVSPRNDCV